MAQRHCYRKVLSPSPNASSRAHLFSSGANSRVTRIRPPRLKSPRQQEFHRSRDSTARCRTESSHNPRPRSPASTPQSYGRANPRRRGAHRGHLFATTSSLSPLLRLLSRSYFMFKRRIAGEACGYDRSTPGNKMRSARWEAGVMRFNNAHRRKSRKSQKRNT